MEPDPPQEERFKAAALQLELPSAMPREAAEATPEVRHWLPGRTRGIIVSAIAVTLVTIAGFVAVEVLVPRYVRRTCIEEAAAHGIALAIDDVALTGGGFTLKGVKATAADLPDVSVEAPEIRVETRGLRPEKLTAGGMEVAIGGRWSHVSAELEQWRASERGGQGGAWAPSSVVIDGSRIVWRGAIGDQATLEAAGVHLDVVWQGRDPTMHATSSHVTVVVPGGSLGPWRVDLDGDPGTSRARIALDPGVPEACTVLLVGNDHAITSAEIAIPRSPMARLGIAPAMLGLHGDPQLAATLHYAPLGAVGNASSKGGVYGVTVDGIPQPIDIAWDVTASGPNDAIDLKAARIAVGPLVGAARGTLKTYADGFRVDVGWSAGPVPCAAFDAPLGLGQPFDIAYELRKLVESAGLAKLKGDVSASATLTFDSRDLGATSATFIPKASCDFARRR